MPPARRRVQRPDVIVPPGYHPPADAREWTPPPAPPLAPLPTRLRSGRQRSGPSPSGPSPSTGAPGAANPITKKEPSKGRIIAIVLPVIGLLTAAFTAVPSLLSGGDKPGPPGGGTVTVNNVIMQNGEYRPPPPGPQGDSSVDGCLIGRWVGTQYTRTFQVDTTPVDLRAGSGASFGITFRDDGTGTDTITNKVALTGSAGGYNVTLTESGTGTFRFVGRDGDLAVETTDNGSYDFAVVINGWEVPRNQLQYSGNYTIRYMCSPDRLVLTASFFHIEYATG